MSRRFPAPARRSPIAVRHLLVLMVLVLLGASGTAFTATLEGVPRTSVELDATDFPEFDASALSFVEEAGVTIARFTITSSDPAVPPGQVYARVRSAATPDPAFQSCSTTDPARSAWRCPVPNLTLEEAQANAAGFESFATP